ncbi:MAG: DUF1178 family protein [Pseudomonadota bacterium]
MIQYALKCHKGHKFDSWFQSADAYEKLSKTGMVCCVVCGSDRVEKDMMTPRVTSSRKGAEKVPALSEPENPLQEKLAKLRNHIEANSDYVGTNFASEARAMHSGDQPERAIHGEARPDEAKALIEDGIPVAPLPFLPTRKAN